jgi:acid phosphatase type 7
MVASNANWQLVTTFSEWGEGTIVEPAAEWVSASGYGQYLDALHTNGNSTAPTSTAIAPTRTATVVPTGISTPEPPQGGSTNVLLLAGDICKHNQGSTDYTPNCLNTGNLVRSVLANNPGAQVQTAGDNVNNDSGSTAYDSQYNDLYAPNWGSFLNVTHTAMGNHDTYAPSGTTPYFNYFGTHAGTAPGGYYSYDIGSSWHVVVLNTNCSQAGGCSSTSPQVKWLQSDLAANTRQCVLAVWHQPRWTSGRHADDTTSAPFWDLLYQYKADIVVNGHNHNYERFNLINPQEQAAADGIREFIVGTGGAPADGYTYASHPLDPNEAIRNQTGVYGVLQLTLGNGNYQWKFLPASGYSFTDSGQENCH